MKKEEERRIELEQRYSQSVATKANLEMALTAASQAQESIQSDIVALASEKARCEALEKDLAKANRTCEETKRAATNAKSDCERYKEQVKRFERIMKEQKAEVKNFYRQQMDKHAAELQVERDEMEKKILELNKQEMELSARLANADVAALEEERKGLVKLVFDKEKECKNAKDKYAAAELELQSYRCGPELERIMKKAAARIALGFDQRTTLDLARKTLLDKWAEYYKRSATSTGGVTYVPVHLSDLINSWVKTRNQIAHEGCNMTDDDHRNYHKTTRQLKRFVEDTESAWAGNQVDLSSFWDVQ